MRMRPRLACVGMLLVVLAAGCSEPAAGPAPPDAAAGAGEPIPRPDRGGTPVPFAADGRLALGACVSRDGTTLCPVNLDPETGRADYPLHLVLDGIAGNVSHVDADLTWQAQSPTTDQLEAYVIVLDCTADPCVERGIFDGELGPSPLKLRTGAFDIPPGHVLAVRVLRGYMAGYAASGLQEVHLEGTAWMA